MIYNISDHLLMVTNVILREGENQSLEEKRQKEHILLYKILFSFMIMLLYMIGRNIPLYGVDIDAYRNVDVNAQSVIMHALSGDMRNCSIFILGLWPYMLASMLAVLVMAIKSLDNTSKISPKKMNVWTITIMMVIASVQAFLKTQTLIYKSEGNELLLTKIIVFIQLITGMLIVIYMCERVTKYGIGGRTSIFMVNIVDGMFTMLGKARGDELLIPIVIGIVEIAVMIFLETTEKRIAVQRVSIHNIYADKNYIAYKLNPIGVMPLMFASAVFLVPQFFTNMLSEWNPQNGELAWVAENMKLTSTLGICTYLGIICILNITFSLIILSPGKTSEDLLKSGDSILDVYAGKPTKRYLVGTVLRFSMYSSIVICICQGIPLFLQFEGLINPALAMLPCSIMMCTGIWISFYREARVYRNMDRYRPIV